MLIRNFYDVIISLTKENIYSIQLDLASVPQELSAVAHVLQLTVFRFISNFFHVYIQILVNFLAKGIGG